MLFGVRDVVTSIITNQWVSYVCFGRDGHDSVAKSPFLVAKPTQGQAFIKADVAKGYLWHAISLCLKV